MMPIPARIAANLLLVPATGCMLWLGADDGRGYGKAHFEGKSRRLTRVVFKLAHGRWPRRDRELLHSCDIPACCAHRHLSEGTRRQNERDKQSKGRGRMHFVAGGGRAA